MTALVYASQKGRSEVVQILLKGGADPNIQMEDGMTALVYASQRGRSDVVEILINGGANPNIRTNRRNKALRFAIKNRLLRVIFENP